MDKKYRQPATPNSELDRRAEAIGEVVLLYEQQAIGQLKTMKHSLERRKHKDPFKLKVVKTYIEKYNRSAQ